MRTACHVRAASFAFAALFVLGCAAGDSPAADSGSGGSDATGAGVGPGPGSGGSTSAQGAASSAATGAGGGASCVYPAAPYGVHAQEIVDGSLTWEGFAEGSDVAGSLAAEDYFDCDGSKGIHAVLVVLSATWCAPCQMEAQALPGKIAGGWSDAGIRVLTLMVQDASENPATVTTAKQWKDSFGLDTSAVAADPGFVFDHFDFSTHTDHTGFPTAIIIDPRTMKIVLYQTSDASIDAPLEALAAQNAQ